ncbi:MAG: glycosyltransferase family 39 protein [Rhodocyclaceae bacterium]|nr:glycosyltransferase family 39 protein [Rhodocyclaceae bacterium]
MDQASGARLGLPALGRLDLRALARPAALALGAFAVLFLALTWNRYGLASGEAERQMYGRQLLDFYRFGFTGSALQHLEAVQTGGLFDLFAALLELVWHGSVWDLRHLLSGLAGLAGLLAVWRLARLLAGEVAALLATVILCLTGSWSGAMFTHTLEIPLAAALVWALYLQTCLVAEQPAFRRGTVWGLGFAAGLAFGVGDGAWLVPLSLLITLLVVSHRRAESPLKSLPGQLRALLPAALLAAAIALLGRPAVVLGPLQSLFLPAGPAGVTSVVPTLVDGSLLMSNEVPRSYLHEYLVVKLPELMLIGLALALGGRPWQVGGGASEHERRRRSRHAHPMHLPLVLAIVLPMGYAWLFRPALADGLRQFLYLLPPMAVAAALGWRMLWQTVRGQSVAAWSLAIVVSLLAVSHAITLIHLHPYGHAYYNSLVSGLRGAARGWVLDYSAASVREGAEYLNRWAAIVPPASRDPIPVAVCAEPAQARAWLSPRFEVVRDPARAAFVIANSHLGCLDGIGGTPLYTVMRQGVTLGQVIDRRGQVPQALPG